MLRIAMNKDPSQHPNWQYKELAPVLYTIQQVLTKRSAQWRKAFWALPAVDLHSTQVLQGLIASHKLPFQLCAMQACMSHWLTRAMCSRSEQSTAHDATFPKMDTHRQSSRAIPLSLERGGRHVGDTCLESLSEESGPCVVHCTTSSHSKVSSMEKLSGRFQL